MAVLLVGTIAEGPDGMSNFCSGFQDLHRLQEVAARRLASNQRRRANAAARRVTWRVRGVARRVEEVVVEPVWQAVERDVIRAVDGGLFDVCVGPKTDVLHAVEQFRARRVLYRQQAAVGACWRVRLTVAREQFVRLEPLYWTGVSADVVLDRLLVMCAEEAPELHAPWEVVDLPDIAAQEVADNRLWWCEAAEHRGRCALADLERQWRLLFTQLELACAPIPPDGGPVVGPVRRLCAHVDTVVFHKRVSVPRSDGVFAFGFPGPASEEGWCHVDDAADVVHTHSCHWNVAARRSPPPSIGGGVWWAPEATLDPLHGHVQHVKTVNGWRPVWRRALGLVVRDSWMWELDPLILKRAHLYPGDMIFSWNWREGTPVNEYHRCASELESLSCEDGVVYSLGPPHYVVCGERRYCIRTIVSVNSDWGGLIRHDYKVASVWVWLFGRSRNVPHFSVADPAGMLDRARCRTDRATKKLWYELTREGTDVRAQAHVTDAMRDALETPGLDPEEPVRLARRVEAAQAAVRSARRWQAL